MSSCWYRHNQLVGVVMRSSWALVWACWFVAHYGEGLDDDCHYVVDCFAILYESSAYHFMNTVDRTVHPGHRHTGHYRRLLCIGHRGNGHGGRLTSFGCRCGSGRRRGNSRRHGVDDPVIVVARYLDYGMIDTHLVVSMYFGALSGEPERPSCG